MNESQIVKLIKVLLPIGIGVAGLVFAWKVAKEYKRQYAELQDQMDATSQQLKGTIDTLAKTESKLETTQTQLHQAVYEEYDAEEGFVENPELAEMQKRLAGAYTKREPVRHNAFEDNIAFDVPENGANVDIPEKMIKEKEKNMQYSPDSQEAFNAYKRMILVDYEDEDLYFINQTIIQFDLPYPFERSIDTVMQTLTQLFDRELPATLNEYDENIVDDMKARRLQYFGRLSHYCDAISYAELIIYWVEKLQEDFGMSNLAWAWTLMNNMGVFEARTGEELDQYFEQVMTHEHHFGTHFGLFGLDTDKVRISVGENGRFIDQYNAYVSQLLMAEEGPEDDNE